MQTVTLDPALRAKLDDLHGPVELRDEAGRTLGHFLPAEEYRRLLLASAGPHLTDEALDRARREPGGRTLAEIWERLGRS